MTGAKVYMNMFIKRRRLFMPKVIEGVRELLLKEVRRELKENGYAKTTVRSVASRCKVGLGTVYNYFPSKDMLIASVIAEDWKEAKSLFLSSPHTGKKERAKDVYDMLSLFMKDHESIFRDPEAERKYCLIFSERHSLMRREVASLLRPVCTSSEDPDFLSSFLSEALLSWIMTDVEFEKLYSIIGKLI